MVAIRDFTSPSEVARLHELMGSRVFDLLINIPSQQQSTADMLASAIARPLLLLLLPIRLRGMDMALQAMVLEARPL